MRRHLEVGKVFEPVPARLFVGVILHHEENVFVAPAANQIDAVNEAWILRKEDGVLTQTVVVECFVKLPVAQMIRAVQISAQRSHPLDYLPQLGVQLLVVKLVWRRHFESGVFQPLQDR